MVIKMNNIDVRKYIINNFKNDSVEENTDDSDANKSEVEEVDIDNADNTENSDIEISQDIAPELPKEVIDMSNAMNPPEGE